MGPKDPEELADELEREADELSRHSTEVQRAVDEARQDWQRKRADESVPGAPPPAGKDEPPEGGATGV